MVGGWGGVVSGEHGVTEDDEGGGGVGGTLWNTPKKAAL